MLMGDRSVALLDIFGPIFIVSVIWILAAVQCATVGCTVCYCRMHGYHGKMDVQYLACLPRLQVAADLYKDMFLGREFEEMCAQMYYRGKMFGFVHLYSGQEAVSTGVIRHLRQDDYICSTYRDHVHALSKNVPARYTSCLIHPKYRPRGGWRVRCWRMPASPCPCFPFPRYTGPTPSCACPAW